MSTQGFFDDAGEWLGEALESFGEFLESPKYAIARGTAKNLARAYSLGDSEDEVFEELWALTTRATIFSLTEHERLTAEVDAQLALLPRMANLAPMGTSFDGTPRMIQEEDAGGGAWRVHSGDVERRYVVFSDHHMLDDGHRQEFFGRRRNRDLYVEALTQFYGPADFTLVENGDVEELLILDPELHEVENIYRLSSREVAGYRRDKSKPLLRRIVQSNRRYYDAVVDHFASRGRYVKITGNYDRDMAEEEFASIVADELGKPFPVACDLLVLRNGDRAAYLICHGHQFDSTCTPRFAREAGELFSQGSGWAFQGPDRFWLTDKDPIGDWLAGRRTFKNMLVTSEVERTPLDDVLIENLLFGGTLVNVNGEDIQEAADAFGKLIGNLNTERGWENLYGKQIAWEYFDKGGRPAGLHRPGGRDRRALVQVPPPRRGPHRRGPGGSLRLRRADAGARPQPRASAAPHAGWPARPRGAVLRQLGRGGPLPEPGLGGRDRRRVAVPRVLAPRRAGTADPHPLEAAEHLCDGRPAVRAGRRRGGNGGAVPRRARGR